MVGVPGRSQACNTCRKRKKGCDLRRPICGQCQKTGVECTGYARQRQFVNATFPNASHTPKTTREYGSVALPETLTRSAYEDKYLGLFWEAYLPGGRAISEKALQASLGGWSNTIQDLYLKDDVLRKALLAMSMRTIGRRNDEKWMVEEGFELYIGALQDMSLALSKPSRARADALLAASKLFSMYEAQWGASDRDRMIQAKSWLAHCSGEVAIMASRTPEYYVTGHAHRLFVDGRFNLAIMALIARKTTILSETKWKTIPWREHEKSVKDRLNDILVDLPSLFEYSDKISLCDDLEEKAIQLPKLIAACWAIDKRLIEWYTVVWQIGDSTLDLPIPDASESIKVEHLGEAHIMTLYWSICLILYRELANALGPNVSLPERADLRRYCWKILRIAPIFLHPAVGTFRAHLATFPLGVIERHLRLFVPDTEWLEERNMLAGYFRRSEANSMAKFVGNWANR